MPFVLTPTEPFADEVHRCAAERLVRAASRLEAGGGDDPVAAVHEARKDLKKARALLRLARPALPSGAYRAENEALRAAGRELSGARDADVMVEVVDALQARFAGRAPAEEFAALRDRLAERRSPPDTDRFETVRQDLAQAALRAEAWPLRARASWDDAVAGLAHAYVRGRRAMRAARREPEPERLHDWRKRVKDLRYQQRLLRELWPEVLGAQADAAQQLAELLGDDHDLAVLLALLDEPDGPAGDVPADLGPLRALAALRRVELQGQAFALGELVYAEKPKAFARRVGRYARSAR